MKIRSLAWLCAVALASPAFAQVTAQRLIPPATEPTAKPIPPPRQALQAPEQASEPDIAPEGIPTMEEGGRLDLMCFGGGSANKAAMGTAYGWNNYGDFGSATVLGQRSQGFEDQVSLEMLGSEGRVRMPRTMLPIVRGGKDGWFKLSNVQVKPNEITASVSVNPFNNPKLRLDRYTGSISISGKAGDYSGSCQRYNPATMQRRF